MTTSSSADPAATAALAAAVVAAAEIAKNSPLFYSDAPPPSNETAPKKKKKKKRSNDHDGTGANKQRKTNVKHFLLTGEESEKRLARSRERNREHARRTRLRKKAQLEALQARVVQLTEEGRLLKQSIEECSIASILVGLSSGNQETASLLEMEEEQAPQQQQSVKVTRVGKRKRFVVENGAAPQPLVLCLEGKMTLIGGEKTHINWKSGVYSDEHGMQRQLTPQQLESLRRERNRMHAKMTRDRKKSFISSVQETIVRLERDNKRMRDVLTKVADMTGSESVTPVDSPKLIPIDTPDIQEECENGDALASELNDHLQSSFNLSTT